MEKEASQHRSREDLIEELAQLRQRNLELESSLDAEISKCQEYERQLLAKEALAESEERLQALMNHNPCLVFLKDEAGKYIYLNQTYEEKFVGSKDWYGKTDFDFWSGESARLFQANDQAVMKSGQVYQYMEDSIALDGNRYCWLCYKFPFTDSKNRRYLAGIGIDATGRVEAEEALYHAEQKFQAIVENNVDFIWAMDAQGRYTYCSPQMEKLWGVKPEEMVGRTAFKLIPPEVRTNALEIFENCAASRVGINQFETFSFKNDGTPIYHETSAVPSFGENGIHIGFYGVTRDITERRRTEEALRESEGRLRALTMASTDVIYRMRSDWSTMTELYGKGFLADTKEPNSNWINEYIHPLDQEYVTGVINECIRERKPFELEHRVLREDGSIGWTYSRAIPILNNSGEIMEWFGAASDITESKCAEESQRKHAEENLRKSEERFAKIFYSSPDIANIIDMESDRYVDINKNFTDVLEYTREEVIGRTPNELNLVVDQDHYQKRYHELVENGVVLNDETTLRSKSGKLIKGLYSTEIIDINGKNHRLTVIKDLTKEKLMEAEIARLDRLNLIGEMAASIGHEIRNPMTSARGFLQLLGSKPEYQDDKDYFELMIEELDRANAIITEYLGMAKNKRIDLQPNSLDIIITVLYPMLMSDANLMGVNIHLDLCNSPQILVDEREIRQLIINIARNGMEAMSGNGTLTIGTKLKTDEIVLYIKDEGPGLPLEIVHKLGTPFLTTKDNGAGLGLAVCYSIAARHAARIGYETGPSGTTFYVRFPIPV